MYTNSTRINGNLVYLDDSEHVGNLEKWIDAFGRGVVKDCNHFLTYNGNLWTATAVSAGGTSQINQLDNQGGAIYFYAGNNENDGVQIQRKAECFKFTTDDPLYFGIRWKLSDRRESDVIVGLCIKDTTLIGGMSDGVYFRKADDVYQPTFVTEKNSTETETSALATLTDDTYVVTEFYWNGSVAASVSGITRSGTTATVTQTAHGYATGFSVTIAGATQTAYNGTYTITVVDANTYTYTVAGSPATPATGTITAVASIVRAYVDGVLKATHNANIPDDEELALSMAYLNGAGLMPGDGMTVDWVRCIQCLKAE